MHPNPALQKRGRTENIACFLHCLYCGNRCVYRERKGLSDANLTNLTRLAAPTATDGQRGEIHSHSFHLRGTSEGSVSPLFHPSVPLLSDSLANPALSTHIHFELLPDSHSSTSENTTSSCFLQTITAICSLTRSCIHCTHNMLTVTYRPMASYYHTMFKM